MSIHRSRRSALAASSLAALALVATAARAQTLVSQPASPPAIDARSAATIRDAYLADLDTIHVKIMALANAIPEEKYGWRPTQGVRSVSEALMHVASEWYYFTPMSVGGKAPADFGPPRESLKKLETITSKADVLAQLEKSWTHCAAQVRAADPAQLTGNYKPWGMSLPTASYVMAGDLHEHLGQLIAYARSVGVTPPWSK
jgi:uncharacterized damage-inducible protein DinB